MAYETIDHRNDVMPDDTVYVFACAPDFQTFFKLSTTLISCSILHELYKWRH